MKSRIFNKTTFICMSILLLWFSTAMAESWQVKIQVKGLEVKGMYKSDITIGVGNKEQTMEAPPLPPTYSCLIYLPSSSWMEKYNQWIQSNDQKENQWILAINPHGNHGSPMEVTATLSWDPKTFGAGTALLKKGWQGDGEVLADMKKVSSINVTGGNLDQYFTITYITK